MSLVLQLDKVEKIFGGLRAIGGVSFEVREKQIFGLIGPNGAGKTTIFNCVTGVYRPERGDVRFLGQSLVGRKPFQIALAGVGRTFQNIRLIGEMTVLENVTVAAHSKAKMSVLGALFRSGRHEAAEASMRVRAEELLDIFELGALKDEPAGSLPYGSQRRLEIARALMLDPKLLLLDEPAAGMNSGEADKLKEQVRWLRDRFGLSIVLVEHNMQVVMGVCEHVHCVDHGETIASGTPAEVQNHPAVLAAYLGQDEEHARESIAAIEQGTIGELIEAHKHAEPSPPAERTSLSEETAPPVAREASSNESSPPAERTSLSEETAPPAAREASSNESSPPAERTSLSEETAPPAAREASSNESSPPAEREGPGEGSSRAAGAETDATHGSDTTPKENGS
jgi:branched-chain amino acid transport system ATP-binding protein